MVRTGSLTAAFSLGACVTVVGAIAAAQPVPVLSLVAQEHAPSSEALARVVASVGTASLSGAALSSALIDAFGRFAPQEDVLRSQRAAVEAGMQTYFRQGAREARQRLGPALVHMEDARDALELRDENRELYLRALMLLARIEIEAHHDAIADGYLRRAIALNPSWEPTPNENPPSVIARFRQLRPSTAPDPAGASGVVNVRMPREGCTMTLDGRAQPSTARAQSASVAPGSHRVQVNCGQPSRVRVLTIGPGQTVSAAIDVRLDAALQTTGAPTLGYASAAEVDGHLSADATAVGLALGARRVILVGSDAVRLVNVGSGEVFASLSVGEADLEGRVQRALSTEAPPVLAGEHPEAGMIPRRADAPRVAPERVAPPVRAPWVVVGAGGLMVVGGVVVFILGQGALDRANATCGGDLTRCPEDRASMAQPDRDSAANLRTAAFVTGGIGLAAVVVGALWYGLAPRRDVRVGLRGGSLQFSVMF